ncbi:unnamed protein product [marine sediment metagenome]|uniref:Uncharacterized protein n=1 Tax=marine sediment metagenome TaxID=412755 RepID=X1UPZ9_9ZZZZ
MGELDSVIHFWRDFLAHNRAFLDPSMIYFIDATVKYLSIQLKREAHE